MDATESRALADALARAERHSPFLRGLIERHPTAVDRIGSGDFSIAASEEQPIARALRLERQQLALAVAIGDLAGLLSFEQATAALSDFADAALDRAIAAAIEERTPGAPAQGFAAIALGKQGSRELNYSSDIDPILIFDPTTLPCRPREEPADAAVRIARRVVELLQARDADGYVLRVDLRLRPTPEVTPIALPVEAAIGYYESSAVAWERAAFIRARAAAGDKALGRYFLDAIRPFVWRRSLDFGAIGDIRGVSRRIRDHHSRGQRIGPGYDLKRGRGGIREVEFFAQIHQLIHGGREPALRAPATLDALAALGAGGRIGEDEARSLGDAYRLLRTIEHRVQMVDDRQTHSLPLSTAELDNVAHLHGAPDGAALIELLAPHVEAVGSAYDALEGEAAAEISHDPQRLALQLREAGFGEADAARARIESWRTGTVRALRSEAARDALEAVLPGLIDALGQAPDPSAAINRLDGIINALPSAINFFRLLEARPALARMLGDILSYAPTLAERLGRRPELLDGLIDATALEPPPPVAALAAAFGEREAGDDYQMLLDRVRGRVNEKRFALGVQLIEGATDPLEVSAGYARVAEAALQVLARAAVEDFEAGHGRVPGSELVILALGRLGGQALTHASDLDLVYLFTGDYQAHSDGPKPLDAVRYYNRLAQRVTAALSVPTASGPLYEVDTRLRPSGAQGPLCVSLDGFERYQREDAWTWEHMALTRARPVFGSPQARAAVEAIVAEALAKPRDEAALVEAARSMRADIHKHKPPSGPLDAKLIDGGLVDLEFCVHVSQLRHRAGFDPRLDVAIGELSAAGLLAPEMFEAHSVLARLLVTLRLVSPSCAIPPEAAQRLVARACRAEDWDSLLASYEEARQTVAREWRRISGDDQ